MAGIRGTLLTSTGFSTTTAARTLLQLAAPANQSVFVKEVEISFDGTTANAPKVLVEIVRTAAGGTATNVNPTKEDPKDTENLQATGKENFSAEPAGGVVIRRRWIHPQSDYTFRLNLRIKGGETLGIRTTVATAVNAHAGINYEE